MKVSSPRAGNGLQGGHVLGAMLVFFGVIIAADSALIYKALATFGGVDNVNAYRDGLAYNRRIARGEEQARAGWADTVELMSSPRRLQIQIKDANGAGIADKAVLATLGRPATNRFDVAVALTEVAPGVYEGPVTAESGGTWIISLRVYDRRGTGEPAYRSRRRIWIAP